MYYITTAMRNPLLAEIICADEECPLMPYELEIIIYGPISQKSDALDFCNAYNED